MCGGRGYNRRLEFNTNVTSEAHSLSPPLIGSHSASQVSVTSASSSMATPLPPSSYRLPPCLVRSVPPPQALERDREGGREGERERDYTTISEEREREGGRERDARPRGAQVLSRARSDYGKSGLRRIDDWLG